MDLGDNEPTLTLIPGKSGKAYMEATLMGSVFVKMNTSPILAWPSQRTNRSSITMDSSRCQMAVICVLRNG